MAITTEDLGHDIYILRFGEDGYHDRFGDPYRSMMVLIKNGTHAHLKGAIGEFKYYKMMYDYIIKEGFETVSWERRRAGEAYEIFKNAISRLPVT